MLNILWIASATDIDIWAWLDEHVGGGDDIGNWRLLRVLTR